MTEDQAKSGSSAAVVAVVVLLVLIVPCAAAGLFLLAGFAVFSVQAPQPPLPPVPGANSPLPTMPLPGTPIPGNLEIPAGSITVNEMRWSQNLFEASNQILTLAKYDQIKPGLTYDEVLSTLAIPENRRPPDIELVGPESDVELKWFGGPEGALSITVKMKGKTVIDKAQTGLK
jgi:hypothetical protein